MLRARVIGNVWSSRRLDEVPNGAFLEVEVEGGSRLVAFDVLGTGIGESVLVATGSVASGWFPNRTAPPIDALIIGIVAFVSIVVLVFNLIVDVAYGFIPGTATNTLFPSRATYAALGTSASWPGVPSAFGSVPYLQ